MADFLAAALAMARRGFRVFPLRPFGKKPAIAAFQFVATTDEATLRAWWTDVLRPEDGLAMCPLVDGQRQCNIGILTTDMVVADIDVKDIGHAAIDAYLASGADFDTFVVATPTGGLHSYFDGPDSKLAVQVLHGVDIRSHNGYVVGPGSYVDPQHANDADIKAVGWYTIKSDLPLKWVPSSIERLLEAPGRRERIDTGIELDTPSAIYNAQEWLAYAPPAIEGQGGDNRTYETSARLVRDYALTDETAFELLAHTWNERCEPPWPLEQLWHKVQNASAYGQGTLGGALPEAFFSGVKVIPTPTPPTAHERGVYMGNLLDASEVKPRAWVVERLLIRGDVSVAASAGGVGKSVVILTAACHWAIGRDFGPYKLKAAGHPLRVMIYNAEDDRQEQTRRVLAICHQYNFDYEAVRKNLAIMDDSDGELQLAGGTINGPVENAPSVNYMIEAAKHEAVDVLVIEPLVNLHTCKETDNGQMRFVMSLLRRIAREANVAVLTAHHTSKGGGDAKGNSDDIRGAGSIVNSARVAVLLSALTDTDLQDFGIPKEDRYGFVRLDDAKANYMARLGSAIAYMKWNTIRLTTGDFVGVPSVANLNDKSAAQAQYIASVLINNMLVTGSGSMNLAEAIRLLQVENELYNKLPIASLRSLVQRLFKLAVHVDDLSAGVLCVHDGKNVLVRLV